MEVTTTWVLGPNRSSTFWPGGGWNVTGPVMPPFGIAVLMELPWDQADRKHNFRLDLLDEDGSPVIIDGRNGPEALSASGELEVHRPPELKPGTPLSVPFAINWGALPLAPGRRYIWQLTIDGESHEDWSVFFDVRPAVADV